MKSFLKSNTLTFLFLLLFVVVAYLTNYVGLFNHWDLNAIVFVNRFSATHSTKIPVWITNLADGRYIPLIVLGISFLFVFAKKYKDALFINLSVNTGFILCEFFKNLFERSRPPLDYHLVHAEGFSFPSGHTILAVCLYGMLAVVLSSSIKNHTLKTIVTNFFAILICSIAFSRIYLGVHYPTDVLGGLLLGVSILLFFSNLYSIKHS